MTDSSPTVGGFQTIPADIPLRAVIVGAGAMGRGWLRLVAGSPLVDLVGVVDLDVEAAVSAAREVTPDSEPAPVTGAALTDVVARAGANVVIDVTVPAAHHPVTLEALGLGLPVLGEKPLAATLAEAVALVRTADSAGQLFMVSQNRRFNAQLWELKAQARRLGEVGILTHEFFKAPRFGGFRDAMDHPLVLDMAIHNFDAARFLLDADPVSAYCEEYNPSWSWYAGDAASTAVFGMSNGARFVYTGSWCSPGLETAWDSRWRVSGRYGSAVWDGENPPRHERVNPALGVDGAPMPEFPGSGLEGSLVSFVSALRTGRRPIGIAADNLTSLAMVYAAIESSRTGARAAVSDVLAAAETEAGALPGLPGGARRAREQTSGSSSARPVP